MIPHKIFERLNIDVTNFEKIVHENTISSTVYKITAHNNKNYILKFSYNEQRFIKEHYFLDILQDIFPVPKIKQTLKAFDEFKGAILMECLEGTVGNINTFSQSISFDMGKLLANLHKIDINTFKHYLPNIYPNYDIASKFEEYFLESFDECKNVVNPNLLNKVEKYYYKNKLKSSCFSRLCITHRDFRPENLIVNNNKIMGVIDFETANFTCQDEDFVQLELLTWIKDDKLKTDFLKGYESILPLPDLEVTFPFIKFIKSLGAIGFTCCRNTYNNEHKFIYDKNINNILNMIT